MSPPWRLTTLRAGETKTVELTQQVTKEGRRFGDQPDPDVDTPAPTTPVPAAVAASPVPQASRRPANLADTGTSAGELSALVLLLLLAGGALVGGCAAEARVNCRWWVPDCAP